MTPTGALAKAMGAAEWPPSLYPGEYGDPRWLAAATTLAALDGWTLVEDMAIEADKAILDACEAEIARLRKIEEAARAYLDSRTTVAPLRAALEAKEL